MAWVVAVSISDPRGERKRGSIGVKTQFVDVVDIHSRAVLRLIGGALAFLVLATLVVVVIGALWLRLGLIAALVLVGGVLVLLAWRQDRKRSEDDGF